MVTDEDLLERSLGGDTSAFGALVERHESAVCAVSFAVTGDSGLSEEVAQDAFLAAWKSLPALRKPSQFKAWTCGIARNLARKARATHARVVAGSSERADPSPSAEELLDARSREAAVWASLESLSPTFREPLVLFYREGRSTREVAKALGLSVSTVEQRLSRGRKQLRAEVMDMVERTLEDKPPSGRVCAAVLTTIRVDAIPVGGGGTTSSVPAPASNSTTMKKILIASTFAATAGLTAYAASSRTRDESASDLSTSSRTIADAPDGTERPTSAAGALRDEPASVLASSKSAEEATSKGAPVGSMDTPFELTKLGPNHVVINVRGGKSEATGSSRDRPVIGHVEGTVLSADGNPVANAVVLGGRSLSMKFGTNIGSQAGVLSDDQGHFALPVFQPSDIGILAAHHEHGMSAAVPTSTEGSHVELRLAPFSWIEGTVREGEGGIPARVMLLGSRAPLFAFGGPTEEDGTFRLGPLPPGSYSATASTSLSDSGTITRLPEFRVRLRPGHSTRRDFRAAEGPMLVLESTLPEQLDIEWIRLGVFTGRREIASLDAFTALAADAPREDYQGITRGGIDAHRTDASFTGLAPGIYTGCLGVSPGEGEGSVECQTVELTGDELEVIDFSSR